MLVVIWEYEVRAGHDAAFTSLYSTSGDWAALFREHDGYIDTQRLRGVDGRFVTIDRWDSTAHYDAFLEAARDRYAAIDARGDALTVAERCIGRYASC
ncbi:antibiotic biosynthesis monooxygenase family protein [Lysobacter fragariae]